MPWDLSCRDWEERLSQGRSLVPTLPLFEAEADRAAAVYDSLKLPDVPGTPTFAEAGGEWFRDIVRALLGSLDPATNTRFVRELFLMVAKKNSKTTNGGALMMTAALTCRRPRGEFLFVGPTQAIADTGFNQAVGMVLADEALEARVHIQEHVKRITVKKTGVRLQIKSFDTKILTGAKPIGTLIDELHLLGEIPDADRVIGQLRGGMLPFPEAFLAFITTQSERAPAGVFRAELMKARAIRDGRLQGAMLPVLYEMPEALLRGTAWREPQNWHMANPNMGRSVTLARLEDDYADAVAKGDGELRRWASQHLNVEIGLALRSDRWEGADYWERNADQALTFDALIARSDVVVVGIDGGGLDDLLGFAALGRDAKTRDWLHWGHAWAHQSVLERRKEIAPTLRDFEAQGDLTICAEPGDDVLAVAELIERLADEGLLPEKNAVGVDPAGITEIVDELEARNITVEGERIIGIRQGWTLSNTIKTTARRLAAETLRHAGQPLLAWSVGNAKIEPKGNAALITKQAAGSAKIDPLMALFNAVALMAKNPSAGGRSIYDTEEREEGFLIV
jgi:phage terminase large subunit-like protein